METKTLIAIWGPSNQGKSGTINKIIEEVIKRFPRALIEIIEDGVDKKVIIILDKIKIGIESQGDPGSRLEESLKDFVKIKCDIIICATRTGGSTVNAVIALENTYDIVWITNYRSNKKDQGALNQLSANQITDYIITLI